jgi:hypothetical protein
VLFPTPGYPIYESQVEYFGGVAQPYRYNQTATGFAIDFDHLRSQITPATRVLIYNNLQNPLGCESSLDEMKALAGTGHRAQPLGAQRRGLLRDAVLRHEPLDRLAAGHARTHRRSCTRSRRSSR